MSDNKLIILRGNSGSGKTTIAKRLQKELGHNTMLISQDVVRRDMLKVRDGKDTLCLPLLKELLKYGRKHTEVVILEGILHGSWYASLFELSVELYGNSIYAYYFDLPFDETLRRHMTKPNAMDFGEKELRDWWRTRDYVAILNEKKMTMEMSIDNIVREILTQM